MSWQREFRVHDPHRSTAIAAIAGATLGAVLAQAWLWPGLALLVLALLAPLFGRVLGLVVTVVCGPGGVTVTTRRGRRHRCQEFRWHEVTATAYSEGRPGAAGTGRFRLETGAGVAFSAGPAAGQLQDLIEVCNAMTPHLPYVWQRQGRRSGGDPAYRSVPRPGVWQSPPRA